MSAAENLPTGVGTSDQLLSLAADGKIAVDVLERLLDMRERMATKEAETDFAAAMSAAQSDMGRISADANNPQTNSKYASYAQLDRQLRPIYTKHGFSLSFDEADSPKAEHIRVICHVSHRGGHTRVYHRDMPVVTTGLAGKVNMTQTHGNASAQSYAMRYLLKGIFNVAIGEDDNDGNGVTGPKITDKQAADINSLIEEVAADRAKFLAWVGVEKVEDIPVKQFQTCVRELQKKRSRK